MKKVWYLLLTAVIFTNISVLSASEKKNNKIIIYIKDFSADEGIKINDPLRSRIKELIQEEYQKDGKFFITDDDDVSVSIQQEGKAQAFGKCSTDACIQKLMEKSNAQVIIYGRVRRVDNFTYITARYMDRTSGVPRVSKIRTIKYRYNDFFEKGVKSLAEYLRTDDDEAVTDFMDEIYTREEKDLRDKNSAKQNELENRNSAAFKEKVEKAAIERKKALTTRSPMFRFGYGFYMSTSDEKINDVFQEQSGYFLDWIFGRNSNFASLGDSFRYDFFFRGALKTYRMNDASINSDGTAGVDIINKSSGNLYACDFGFRIKTIKYLMMTSFEPYFLGALRCGIYNEKAKDKYDKDTELEVNCGVFGGYTGAGIEFAFFENLGFFTEYNVGITSVGKKNINFEGHQVYGGVTLRTEFL